MRSTAANPWSRCASVLEDIDALTDVQYLLSKPLCLVCDDAELLEAALRAYQGRALYEGTLPEAALLPLCDRYGLLI